MRKWGIVTCKLADLTGTEWTIFNFHFSNFHNPGVGRDIMVIRQSFIVIRFGWKEEAYIREPQITQHVREENTARPYDHIEDECNQVSW